MEAQPAASSPPAAAAAAAAAAATAAAATDAHSSAELLAAVQLAASARYVGAPRATPVAALFDTQAPRIKEDILRMVIQYLQNEGYVASVMTLQDEANVKTKEKLNRRAVFKRMRNSILEGDWSEVEKLCARSSVKGYKSLLYAIYKQQYLELVDKQEYQKAFQLLSRRLKPLENMGTTQQEFKDLCYLLTCKSIMDVPSCRDWEGVMSSREKLIDQFHAVLFEFEGENLPDARGLVAPVPPNRLTSLLSQAVEHQIANNHYHPKTTPRIISLLEDYRTFVVPNAYRQRFVGHTRNVKCLEFVGSAGATLATGGGDNSVRLWETETGKPIQQLDGHRSRIWCASADRPRTHVTSSYHGAPAASRGGFPLLWCTVCRSCSGVAASQPAALAIDRAWLTGWLTCWLACWLAGYLPLCIHTRTGILRRHILVMHSPLRLRTAPLDSGVVV
jgi:COMPASS component SWD3